MKSLDPLITFSVEFTTIALLALIKFSGVIMISSPHSTCARAEDGFIYQARFKETSETFLAAIQKQDLSQWHIRWFLLQLQAVPFGYCVSRLLFWGCQRLRSDLHLSITNKRARRYPLERWGFWPPDVSEKPSAWATLAAPFLVSGEEAARFVGDIICAQIQISGSFIMRVPLRMILMISSNGWVTFTVNASMGSSRVSNWLFSNFTGIKCPARFFSRDLIGKCTFQIDEPDLLIYFENGAIRFF